MWTGAVVLKVYGQRQLQLGVMLINLNFFPGGIVQFPD